MNKVALKFSHSLFLILFIGIIGFIAWASYQYPISFDATHGSRNNLSKPTQQLLGSLKQPLRFIAYVPDDADLHQQLRDLVGKYQKFNSQVSLEIVNPDLEPERAQADGVQQQRQVVLKLGKQTEVLGSVMEQSVVNAIQRLQRSDNRLVLFLEGHQEAELFDTSSSGLSQLAKELQKKGFRLQPHALLSSATIPVNTSFIVIATPKQAYVPEEVAILQDYIKKGGNLLWLQEPNQPVGLEELLKTLALEIPQGRLLSVDDKSALNINSPTLIPITRYGEADVMQQQQGQTLFSYATTVQRDLGIKPEWDFDEILTTSNRVWLEANSTEITTNIQFDHNTTDIAGPLNIGMALSRKNTDKDKNQQRVVVIGDSNFMQNGFVGFAGNLELSEHLFNWLSENEHLLVIPNKVVPDTQIDMPQWQLYTLGVLFLLIIPIGLLVIGIGRWVWRKRA